MWERNLCLCCGCLGTFVWRVGHPIHKMTLVCWYLLAYRGVPPRPERDLNLEGTNGYPEGYCYNPTTDATKVMEEALCLSSYEESFYCYY